MSARLAVRPSHALFSAGEGGGSFCPQKAMYLGVTEEEVVGEFASFARADLKRNEIHGKGSGFHQWIMRMAMIGRNQAVPAAKCIEIVEKLAPRRLSAPDEVLVAVKKAYDGDQTPPEGAELLRNKRLKARWYDRTLLRKLGGECLERDRDWWRARRSGPRTPQGFADAIFRPGETIGLQGERNGARRFRAWPYGTPWPDSWAARFDNVFVCDKPLREGAPSWGKKHAIRFDYAVLESDAAEPDDWCKSVAVLERMGAEIVALVDSGGKSIHAWWKVGEGLGSPEKWKDAVWKDERIVLTAASMGADKTVINASVRVARMPGCERKATGRVQELLWTAPTQ